MNAESGKSPVARRALRTAAALGLLVLAALAYVLLIGISLDVSDRGRELARRVSARLGREVRLEGPLALEISARPRLRVERLVVENPPDFGDAEPLARLGELRLQLDLWWLLRGKVFIEELAGADIALHPRERADGRDNWTFARAAADGAAQPPTAGNGASPFAALARALSLLDMGRVSLERLGVVYDGADRKTHRFDLDSAQFHWLQGRPFTLALRGTVEKTFPYSIELGGGSLEQLARGAAWPFEAHLAFLGTAGTFNGEIDGGHVHLTFGLGSADQSEIERLLQIDLPKVGAVGVSGELDYRSGKLSLTRFDAAMGDTTLSGELELDRGGTRPRISGALVLPALDLRPFIADRPQAPPKSLAELFRAISRASFSLKSLAGFDADLRLAVRRWPSLPGDVRDTRLAIRLRNGRLRAPMKASLAGVALSGEASVDALRATPRFRLALGSRDSSLGGLAELLAGAEGVAGELGRLELRLEARGDSGAELVDSLDARLEVDGAHLSYGNYQGGRPVEFRLERLALVWPAGEPLRGDARGALLGQPFETSIAGASLSALAREARTPLEFNVRSEGLHARLHGVLQSAGDESGTELAFEISAPHAGEAARWFGLAPGADARFALAGRLVTRRGGWRVSDFSLLLGRSRLSGELARERTGARRLTRLKLVAEPIDVAELESMLPGAGARAPRKTTRRGAGSGATLDIPILPQGVSLADADIDVRVKRVAGAPLDVDDVAFDGRIREGAMQPSRFAARIADIGLAGTIAVDLRGAEPLATLSLAADAVDVGELLRRLGIARDLDARLDRMTVHVTARASRLGDMLARSELQARLEGGSLVLRDRNTKGELRVALDEGLLSAAPGAPVGLSLIGAIDVTPIAIGVETASLQELADPKLPFPVLLTVGAADSALRLTGRVARPVGRGDIEFALESNGARFSDLDHMVHTALPPWGPWSAAGKFRVSQGGYRVDDLRLQVGTSVLNGRGALDTSRGKPRLDIALESPTLQLDDFRFGDWSPLPKKDAAAEPPRAKAGAKLAQKVDRLLGRETLQRQDASVAIDVGEVLSGKDRLGDGHLEATLADGVATLGPVEVKLPGGDAKLSLVYEPVDADARMQLRMLVDHLDYGVLARRVDASSHQRGIVSLRVEVDSRAAYPSEMLRHGNGRIDFALWPENLQARGIDLWAVNVLESLLPKMDPSSASKVNCAIGRFALADGKLSERTMLIDTSRIRVTGKGSADFGSESFDFRFEPRPKRPEFLSLAIPVEASGRFNDYHIGVSAADVVGGVARLAGSLISVPFERLFGDTLPEDGADVCSKPELFSGE